MLVLGNLIFAALVVDICLLLIFNRKRMPNRWLYWLVTISLWVLVPFTLFLLNLVANSYGTAIALISIILAFLLFTGVQFNYSITLFVQHKRGLQNTGAGIWEIPEGKTNQYCLNILEEPNMIFIGESGDCRNQYINGLLYTALYKNPSSLSLVIVNPIKGSMVDYEKLPHTIAYTEDVAKADELFRALDYIIQKRLKKMQRTNTKQCTEPPIYVFIDECSVLTGDCLLRVLLNGRVANVRVIGFSSTDGKYEQYFGNRIFLGDLDSVPFVTKEDIQGRIEWWVKQTPRLYWFAKPILVPMPQGIPTEYFNKDMTGLEYEKYCAQKLIKSGYSRVKVTPGSGDYGADIIAYDRKGHKICFQCKKYENTVGVSAVQEIIAARHYYDCKKAVVLTTATFTPAAKRLAQATNVELIERFM